MTINSRRRPRTLRQALAILMLAGAMVVPTVALTAAPASAEASCYDWHGC